MAILLGEILHCGKKNLPQTLYYTSVCSYIAYLFSVSLLSTSLDEMKCHFRHIIQCFTHLSVGKQMFVEQSYQPGKVT